MRTRMQDIADKVGVSQSLVSLYLNHHPLSARIAEKTKKKIDDAIREMGYSPNRAAQSLRRKKSNTIGLALVSSRNLYDAALIAELHYEVIRHKYQPFFVFFENAEEQPVATDLLLQNDVDAIITGEARWLSSEIEIPVVSAFYESEYFDSVVFDLEKALRIELEYLKLLGHTTIGRFSFAFDRRSILLPKIAGEMGMTVCGEVDIPNIEMPLYKRCRLLFRELKKQGLSNMPTAFIAQNDRIALGMIRQFYENGIRVPEDVSIIGQDNAPEATSSIPMLTTVDYESPRIVAKKMVEAVLVRLENPEDPRRKIVIPPHMIVRESCANVNTENKRR